MEKTYPSDGRRVPSWKGNDIITPLRSILTVSLQSAWKAIKQRVIEEKLEKLGVEKGSGSNMPNIHAPHARAASVRRDKLVFTRFLPLHPDILSRRPRSSSLQAQ